MPRATPTLRCRAILVFALALIVQTAGVKADARIAGVVVDYSPRTVPAGKTPISILRNGESVPVKEHELLYEGDRLVFADAPGSKAYVRALVDKTEEIILDPAHSTVPNQRWPLLQSLAPKLLSAYRWVNAPAGVDNAEPRNALSRGGEDDVDDLAIFPKARETLTISDNSKEPLWIGWMGGNPPFSVSITQDGKVLQQVDVCKDGSEAGCMREATLPAVASAAGPLTLSVRSSDGASWSRQVKRASIAADDKLATANQLGNLGVFLRATELLDRDADAYMLESARQLATISSVYPPARTLLDNMKNGQVP
jgi:hypothetical protein